jgi:DeoR family transcriptional regulator, aga operon transcriptional repressor
MPIESTLPATVRRERIVELIEERGFVRVADLRDRFGISEVTLRADLDALAKESRVTRIHGGATATRSGAKRSPELPFEQTAQAWATQKSEIGASAAALVESGQTIILDVGTTTSAIAMAIAARADLTDVVVVTSALNIAVTLEHVIPRFTVIVTGGTLRPLQHSLVDPLAGAVLTQIRADIAFIGCSGVDEVSGITNVNLPEADIKRRMLAAAARGIVVADASKLGVTQHSRVASIQDIHGLITSRDADPSTLERLRAAGLDVTVAASVA